MGRASRRKGSNRESQKILVTPDPVTGRLFAVHTAEEDGIKYELSHRSMPEKIAGKHRMIVTVMFRTSLEQLVAAENGEQQLLDMENILDYNSGCWDCEQHFQWCLLNQVCPGDPSGIQHD